MEGVWIQLIITAGTVLAGMFVTIRYAISHNNKKEKNFLEYLDKSEARQLEYYETKNGTIERISESFTKALNKNTKTLDRLVADLEVKKRR